MIYYILIVVRLTGLILVIDSSEYMLTLMLA
jgi:hypothetical protein